MAHRPTIAELGKRMLDEWPKGAAESLGLDRAFA
jgi:hypothetical protein